MEATKLPCANCRIYSISPCSHVGLLGGLWSKHFNLCLCWNRFMKSTVKQKGATTVGMRS